MAEFTKQQKRAIRKLQGRLPSWPPELGGAESFVLNYIGFEAQARKVWHYYRCRKKTKKESKAGIPLIELKNSMQYFEINFNDEKLDLLLDSKLDKRDNKSARNLRNGMVHQWLEQDCKEAANRYDEFISCFEEFRVSLGRTL